MMESGVRLYLTPLSESREEIRVAQKQLGVRPAVEAARGPNRRGWAS